MSTINLDIEEQDGNYRAVMTLGRYKFATEWSTLRRAEKAQQEVADMFVAAGAEHTVEERAAIA